MRFQTPELFLGVLLAVAIFAMGMLFASSYQSSSANQNQSQRVETAEQNKNISSTPSAESSKSAQLHEQRETNSEFWSAKLSDWALVGFTGLLVLFTYRLWKSTEKLWGAGENQIRLAREEFIASHRPKIRLRRVLAIQPLNPNKRVEAMIEAANIGDTKATIVEIGIDIYINGQPFNARPAPIPPITVESGKQANINVIGSQRITQSQIANLATGNELRMLGLINYRDDNGTIRTTSFARRYDIRLCRFVDVPDSDPEKDRDYEN